MCKKNCLGCHFFSYVQMHGMLPQSVTFGLRGCLQKGNGNVWDSNWCCYNGVWHENSFNADNRKGEIFFTTINKDRSNKKSPRGNSCFYMKYVEGMSLEAAEELEKRETIQKEAGADRKQVKLWIIVTILCSLASLVTSCYFHYQDNKPKQVEIVGFKK